jgi:glycosyltransferase involved in cell wall biosynthesis
MACGLPVIGVNSGGIPELVDDKAGALVSVPQDLEQRYLPSTQEVVAAVKKIHGDLMFYSKGARERTVEKFDSKFWILKHKIIFEQVLKSL